MNQHIWQKLIKNFKTKEKPMEKLIGPSKVVDFATFWKNNADELQIMVRHLLDTELTGSEIRNAREVEKYRKGVYDVISFITSCATETQSNIEENRK